MNEGTTVVPPTASDTFWVGCGTAPEIGAEPVATGWRYSSGAGDVNGDRLARRGALGGTTLPVTVS